MKLRGKAYSTATGLLFSLLGALSIALAAAPPRHLPAGTPLPMKLETGLSTADTQAGASFAARVTRSIYYNGRRVIPAGSIVEGHVLYSRDARPILGSAKLLLHPELLILPDGRRYRFTAEVTQAATGSRVDNEGVLHSPRAPMTADVRRTLLSAGTGALAGVVLSGTRAALLGGGIGAAAGVGYWLFSERHLTLKPGAELVISVDQPLALQPSRSEGAR